MADSGFYGMKTGAAADHNVEGGAVESPPQRACGKEFESLGQIYVVYVGNDGAEIRQKVLDMKVLDIIVLQC